MLKLLALAVAGALLASICAPAFAQGGAPQGMPQQQFDDLVNAITKSVLEKIRSEKPPARTPPPASRSPFDAANQDQPDEITLFFGQAATTLKAVPRFGHYLGEFRRALDQSAQGGMGRRVFLLLLAAVVAVALAIEAMLRGYWVGCAGGWPRARRPNVDCVRWRRSEYSRCSTGWASP